MLGVSAFIVAMLTLGLIWFNTSPVPKHIISVAATESAYRQAKQMHRAGGSSGAVPLFRQALAGRFDDPERRLECMRYLAAALVRTGRSFEAVGIYRELPEHMLADTETTVSFITALTDAYEFDEAATRAATLLETAEADGNRPLADQARRLQMRITMLEPDVMALRQALAERFQ